LLGSARERGSMKTQKFMNMLFVLTTTLALAGCSSTRLVTSWHDDSFRPGKFSRPLVVALVKKQVIRAKLEDEFARELRTIGVDAVQSYRVFPEQEELNPDTIRGQLPGTGRDSILVTHLVDVKKEIVNVPARTDVYPTGGMYAGPGYYNSFGSYYAQSYSVVSSPAYSYESKVFVAETNLYDGGTDKLVWTVVTETEEPSSIDSAVTEFVGVVVKDLRKNRIF